MVSVTELLRQVEEEESRQAQLAAPPAAAAANALAGPSAPATAPATVDVVEHRNHMKELHHEVESLRRLQERAIVLGWAVLAAIGVALLVCLGFCMQSSRQLAHATALLAYSCEMRRPPGSRFP